MGQASVRETLGGNAVSRDGRLTYGNIVKRNQSLNLSQKLQTFFDVFDMLTNSCSLINNSCKWKSF